MDALGHQARAGHVEAASPAVPVEEVEVRTPVVINEESSLTVVAPLNNGVRPTRNADSGHARHVQDRPLAGRKADK